MALCIGGLALDVVDARTVGSDLVVVEIISLHGTGCVGGHYLACAVDVHLVAVGVKALYTFFPGVCHCELCAGAVDGEVFLGEGVVEVDVPVVGKVYGHSDIGVEV